MNKTTWIVTLLLVILIGTDSSARREVLSQEQKDLLKKVQRVLVETVAITDAGTIDPGPLVEVVTRRLLDLGYTVLTDPAQPHDVVFRVKCEQRKVWEGTS
ncbi:MAG: HEAT repeat domain-containing protein, partial [Candidatus Methylomirabilis sp.]